MNWVQQYHANDCSVEIENLDGLTWYDAPIPARFHRCRPQTRGYINYLTRVFRCRCGALSQDGKHWSFRNERRRK